LTRRKRKSEESQGETVPSSDIRDGQQRHQGTQGTRRIVSSGYQEVRRRNYKVDAEKVAPFIKKYLKGAVASGSLVQTKGKGASGSFKLASSTSGNPLRPPHPRRKNHPPNVPPSRRLPTRLPRRQPKTSLPKAKKTAAEKKSAAAASAAAAKAKKSAASSAEKKTRAAPKPRSPSKAKKSNKAGPTKKPKAPKPKTAKAIPVKVKKAASPKRKK
ncbi:unnamed protein product, partial [Tenebrio molitor]